jgi:hypothetical protein
MSDEEQPGLSAADEARIRALLADARYDEPMPDAVVARLDRVLAGLAEEPLARSVPSNVVPLAERRRRATRMLVAAAAVVIAGFGIGRVVSDHSGSASGSANAGSAPEADSRKADGPESRGFSTGSASSDAGSAPEPADGLNDALAYQVRPRHFAKDTERVQKHYDAVDLASLNETAGCSTGQWGAGQYVPVSYGRAPAYLVLRRATGDSQVADLFLCGSTDPVRSITLPGP